jgi:hypothetical protein
VAWIYEQMEIELGSRLKNLTAEQFLPFSELRIPLLLSEFCVYFAAAVANTELNFELFCLQFTFFSFSLQALTSYLDV